MAVGDSVALFKWNALQRYGLFWNPQGVEAFFVARSLLAVIRREWGLLVLILHQVFVSRQTKKTAADPLLTNT